MAVISIQNNNAPSSARSSRGSRRIPSSSYSTKSAVVVCTLASAALVCFLSVNTGSIGNYAAYYLFEPSSQESDTGGHHEPHHDTTSNTGTSTSTSTSTSIVGNGKTPLQESSSSSSRSLGSGKTLTRQPQQQLDNTDDDNSLILPPVPCTIHEYTNQNVTLAVGAGSRRPTVLRDVWKPPNESWNNEQIFLKRYGEIPYYIKDRFVQVHGEQCVAQFQDLWAYIRTSLTTSISPELQKHRISLLTFTNDLENPALFGEDRQKLGYQVPEPVQHVNDFAILSTMTRGQSHEFHKHGESWIAQASGHKVWWFLPPDVATRPIKQNACGYLDGTAKIPPGTTTCIQSPGDVIWFPKDWYHATCSLTEWNIAIGAQQGVRLRQEFKTLPMTIDDDADVNADVVVDLVAAIDSRSTAVQEKLQLCSRETGTVVSQ